MYLKTSGCADGVSKEVKAREMGGLRAWLQTWNCCWCLFIFLLKDKRPLKTFFEAMSHMGSSQIDRIYTWQWLIDALLWCRPPTVLERLRLNVCLLPPLCDCSMLQCYLPILSVKHHWNKDLIVSCVGSFALFCGCHLLLSSGCGQNLALFFAIF